EHRMVTLAHAAIEGWQWPAMVMDFTVDEAVDMSRFGSGMNIHVEIRREDNNFVISQVHIPDMDPDNVQPTDAMEHSDLESMNHQEMDHSGMDHSEHQQEAGQ
ncbi:MAG: copper-binding protein, partial [Porticoccus sp.]